jgi:glycosyltransferase involved in cell wall biosynthesis
MNIGYLIHSFKNQAGTENYVYHMSMALARLGHHVHIVSLTGKGQRDFKGLEDRISIHQFDLKKPRFRVVRKLEGIFPLSTWRYGRLISKILPAIIKDHAIDIIEATDWGMDAWDYLPKRQVPVCVRLHGYPGFKEEFDRGRLRTWPKNHIGWTIQRKHILSADLVTCVSKSYADFVWKAWEIKGQDATIIPIAVDLQVFHPGDMPREGQSILFAGRLEESKGIEILAQAIPLVLKRFPGATFYVAGQDRKYKANQHTWSQYLTRELASGQIIYLGCLATEEIVRYYQTSTVCVVPSLYEPGGTVAFEAMACGCPVIASRVGGLEEVIHDRQTGLLIPPGNAMALADGLIELLQQDQLRRELAQQALESMRKQFDINIVAQQTVDAYARAITVFKTDQRSRHQP